ncbi:MAG: Maf family protein [Bryobacteraceae bacterium]
MLVLASQSPRRRELLARAGFSFVVRPVEVDETWWPGEEPAAHVERLAREKARVAPAGPDDIVLGADTVVVVDGEILGKPADAEDAARMLRKLSGRMHRVLTGVCLKRGPTELTHVEATWVSFATLDEQEIRDYVASGEPMDKAGAYAIQGLASRFVKRIEGCYFNVVGLPVASVYRLLKQLAGVSPL